METFDVSQEIDLSFIEERIEKSLDEKKIQKKTSARHPQLKNRTDKSRKEKETSCKVRV